MSPAGSAATGPWRGGPGWTAAPGAASVESLGEFGLIAAVTARLPQGEGVLIGPGDDAAVLAPTGGALVATTDVLVEGRHFRTDWSGPYDVGRKAAAANLADVAAMGARPVALLVGLAAPAQLGAAAALALTEGLRDEAAQVGASVVGGDVVGASSLSLAVTALGGLHGRDPVTRGGARPGDVVAVCGRLGWSAAGLALLSAGAGPGRAGGIGGTSGTSGRSGTSGTGGAGGTAPTGADWGAAVLAGHRAPSPPYAAGPQAADLGARAMCDVSDGLLQDLGHVAAASGVGIEIDVAAIVPDPVVTAAALQLGADPLGWVLTGGEDHALAASFPPARVLPASWRVVGRVVAGRGVRASGYERGPTGWDHYR